jgi:hypothetical protein
VGKSKGTEIKSRFHRAEEFALIKLPHRTISQEASNAITGASIVRRGHRHSDRDSIGLVPAGQSRKLGPPKGADHIVTVAYPVRVRTLGRGRWQQSAEW